MVSSAGAANSCSSEVLVILSWIGVSSAVWTTMAVSVSGVRVIHPSQPEGVACRLGV